MMFNFILPGTVLYLVLIPHLILVSSMTTGDTYSKSTNTTYTDEEFVIIQNNTVTAVSNTGSQSGTSSTGNATAVSEVNINNGNVEGKLQVEANGDKKILNVEEPGDYKLEINKDGDVVATSEVKTNKNAAKKDSLLTKLLNFIFSIFR